MIGVMHTSTNRHIVAIFMWLNSVLPARLSIVWRAAYTLPFVFFDVVFHCSSVIGSHSKVFVGGCAV